jgi:uncharacterized membrane protein
MKKYLAEWRNWLSKIKIVRFGTDFGLDNPLKCPCSSQGAKISNLGNVALSVIMSRWCDFMFGRDWELVMRGFAHRNLFSARIGLACIWGVLCALALASPVLQAHSFVSAAAVLHASFSRFCHQIPHRSFFLLGHPLPVCQRCFGLYLGLFFGSFIYIPFFYRSRSARRMTVAIACLPALLDVFLTWCGVWPGAGVRRCVTGWILGYLISPLLTQGMEELLRNRPRRRADRAPLQGGLS